MIAPGSDDELAALSRAISERAGVLVEELGRARVCSRGNGAGAALVTALSLVRHFARLLEEDLVRSPWWATSCSCGVRALAGVATCPACGEDRT